ncbi:MAG: hypothetical protein LBD98_04085 [Endomicrobium sp.]|jgi:hypothetical protein|nr:hypothetical protein [Endomicrobium sp.]
MAKIMEVKVLINTFKQIDILIKRSTGCPAEQSDYDQCRDFLLKEYYSAREDKNFEAKFPQLIIEYDTLDSFWKFIKKMNIALMQNAEVSYIIILNQSGNILKVNSIIKFLKLSLQK